MPFSGILRRVTLVRTDVSEKHGIFYFLFIRSVRLLLIAANVVPSSPLLATQIMEALSSSETSVLTRSEQRNIPEDGILSTVRTSILTFIYYVNDSKFERIPSGPRYTRNSVIETGVRGVQ
jgi:hypothetical protein